MAKYTTGEKKERSPHLFQEPGWILTLSQKRAANKDLETEAATLRTKVDSLETESLSLVAKITGAEAELTTCRSEVRRCRVVGFWH